MADAPHINDARIRERAYALWEQEGCPDGCADRHWQQAEQELGAAASEAGVRGAASSKGTNGSSRRPRPRSTAA